MSRIGKSIQTESRLVVLGGWRKEGINMESPFGMMKKVLGLDKSDDCTIIVNIFNAMNCVL